MPKLNKIDPPRHSSGTCVINFGISVNFDFMDISESSSQSPIIKQIAIFTLGY